jgi:thioredoxin 1
METIIKEVVHLTAQDFKDKVFDYEKASEWKYEGSLPAIVDFYADWCQPCKMVAPILEELAHDYAGKLMVYKVNTENEQELASVFGIQSIPTLLFIPKEGKPQSAMGALPRQTFDKVIQEVLLIN